MGSGGSYLRPNALKKNVPIQLPPTLLSRFDLIFLILDNANKEMDMRLATHMVSLYYADAQLEDHTTGFLVCFLVSLLSFNLPVAN